MAKKLQQSGASLTNVPAQDISIAKKGMQIKSEGLEVKVYIKFNLCGKEFYIRTNALVFDTEHDFVISNNLAKSSGLLQYFANSEQFELVYLSPKEGEIAPEDSIERESYGKA